MPDYSEYIIKENNEIKVFSNRRGAYTFLADVFLGPKLIKEFIYRQIEHQDSIGDNALSAIVLDYDKKEILIEIYPDENEDGSGIFKIEIFLKFLEVRYPKWNIKYAKNGILDRRKYLSNSNDKTFFTDYEKEGWDEPRGTFISINQSFGQTIYWNELCLYELIPKGIRFILNSDNHVSIPENRFPFGGIHLDDTNNKIFFWYSNPTPFIEKWAKQYWQNMNISFSFNGYKTHFALIEQSIFSEVINSSRKTAIEQLKDSIVYSYEVHSQFRKENDRYDDELIIHTTQERLEFLEVVINEINKNSL